MYNYIRLNLYSPSVKFRARLYIERDGLGHRILATLGHTFRSSKWSNFNRPNVSQIFKSSPLKALTVVLSVILFALASAYHPVFTTIYSFSKELITLLWSFKDVTVSWIISITWAAALILNKLANVVYTKIFNQHFALEEKDVNDHRDNSSISGIRLTIADHYTVFYKWLKDQTFFNKSVSILENLFNDNSIKSRWNYFYQFLPTMYHLSEMAKLLELVHVGMGIRKSTFQLTGSNYLSNYNVLNSSSVTTSVKPELALASLHYELKQRPTRFKELNQKHETSFRFINDSKKWNLSSINTESELQSMLVNTPVGAYYLNSSDLENLTYHSSTTPELGILQSVTLNQLNLYKQQRWLYRYSTLHRKILKQSNVITNANRLVSSGFFDSSLVSQNLWASSVLTEVNTRVANTTGTPGFIKSILRSTSGSLLIPSADQNTLNYLPNQLSAASALHPLSNIESSYMWNVKRFHFFNTTFSNYVTLEPTYAISTNTKVMHHALANSDLTLSFKTLSDLPLQSYFLTNKSLNTGVFSTEGTLLDLAYINNVNKSISIELGESDLFTSDTLSLVIDLTSRPNLPNPSAGYFSIVKYSPISLGSYNEVFLNLSSSRGVKSNNLYSYMNVTDKSFVKDLNTLFMILNK